MMANVTNRLPHLVLRWLKYKSSVACSYSRFAALVRTIVWSKKDAMAILCAYGIAPPPDPGGHSYKDPGGYSSTTNPCMEP